MFSVKGYERSAGFPTVTYVLEGKHNKNFQDYNIAVHMGKYLEEQGFTTSLYSLLKKKDGDNRNRILDGFKLDGSKPESRFSAYEGRGEINVRLDGDDRKKNIKFLKMFEAGLAEMKPVIGLKVG